MAKTVGELKKELENFDDNMLLDLYVCCYDRNNYICIKRNNWRISDDQPLEVVLYNDNGRMRIENNDSSDMELSD